MSFISILDDVGSALKKVFTVGETVAKDVEPIVDIAFPGIATLYNVTVTAVANAEAAAIAAGAQSGTGPQKLAMVVAAIEASVNAYVTANNLTIPDQTQIEAWINFVVGGLNLFGPAIVGSAPQASTVKAAVIVNAIPNTTVKVE
jgi:hypothetical protein